MKRILIPAVALAITGGATFAADLPSRKAPAYLPPPPPPPMWTGFYVGLNAGGTWANSNSIQMAAFGVPQTTDFYGFGTSVTGASNYALASAAALTGNLNASSSAGFIGGGQIGYNWQFYTSFVAGMEADIQGMTSSSGSRTAVTAVPLPVDGWWAPGTVLTSAVSASSRLDYIGTVRGRLGWLVTPTLLLYGTGGLAYGGVSANLAYAQWNNNGNFYPDPFTTLNTFGPASGVANFSNTQVGWTAGGGLEWMFWPNWSAKVEYLYYDLGSIRVSSAISAPYNVAEIPGPGGFPAFSGIWATTLTTASMRFNGNIVRAGVNYHFNWGAPAPVVAKY